MLVKLNSQTIHDEHIEISLFLDYFWAFLEVKQIIYFLLFISKIF
jgi:hypothetical protein